ncbi:YozQ family protein [Bacillus aerolatus]|nr:YozQ family protein [Bacillus aerolatus]
MSKKEEKTPAGKTFQFDHYEQSGEIEKGLAVTHEQVSDSYTEGTIDGEIDELAAAVKDFPKQ